MKEKNGIVVVLTINMAIHSFDAVNSSCVALTLPPR